MDEIKPGISAEVSELVGERLTAVSMRSGLVPAYATPAMIALMEQASVAAIQKCLNEGQTSVGVEVNVQHLAATPAGLRVRARSEVVAVAGRRVAFKVEAWDPQEKIGEGTHVRMVVDASRFIDRMGKKAGT